MVFFLEKETKSNIHVFVICQVSSTVQIIKYSIVRCLGTTMRFFFSETAECPLLNKMGSNHCSKQKIARLHVFLVIK